MQLLRITDDRRVAAERLLPEWGGAQTIDDVLATPFLLLGTAAEIGEQLNDRSERFGIETWTVFAGRPIDPSLDDLTAVTSALGR